MSSQLRDSSTSVNAQGSAVRHDASIASAHPRGRGFGVLSRMARGHGEDQPVHVPRHRLDAPVDSAAVTSLTR